MTFFDTTPIGRIVNRFARDVDVVDAWIPNAMRNMINQGLQLITTMIMIAFITPYFLIVLIPVSILFYFIQRFYVPTARQVKRLESITRSPIYSHFAETLSGVSTIRAYGANDRFKLECDKRADLYLSCWNCSIGADRWLAIRLEFVGNIIVMFSALSAVMARETIDPGLIGLSLSYAMNVTMTLTWLVRSTSEVETNIVSIERILEYTGNEMEAEWTQDKMRMSEAWPQTGNIEFKNYGARYRPGMDLVIRDINISILPQEKIGVVGRTGAGKSTITLSLFRIIEAAAGEIIIDGINISVIGLHDLRKKLTIIPQDPVLFSGTLRFNLDPFSEKSDDQLWTCLEHAHLKDFVRSLDQGLDSKVSEGGDNMSVGQRQLVCLARALLRKTKILILDEATAAVDLETDSLIQSTIRSEFADCTIITIAHRLHTIMDSNRVLVLDQGKVVEFESPTVLLENKSSVFHSLAKNAGIVL
jgi:ABC-type multidrug transport system fused ATPase/permease subunit